ncbi:MAG: polyprenol monophosphomannose synthase [bacterium]
MNKNKKILVIIATYNERENLEPLVQRIFEVVPEVSILVVDDNSPDGTGEVADRLAEKHTAVNVIHREGKLGYGTALLSGLRWAEEHGCDAVITMDADFSHDPIVLPEMIRMGGEHPVVLGSRYIPGGRTVNWSLRRRLLSWGGNLFARLMLGVPAHDLTTGFRYLQLDVIRTAHLERVTARGYGFLIETVHRIYAAGIRPAETPITFADRKAGASKMSRSIVVEALLLVVKLWYERNFVRKR